MAKGKMLLRNRTIKEQVFFSMTAVALLAIVILGSSIFFFSKRTIQKNFQAAHVYNVGVSSNIVQIQLDSIVELTRTLLLNTEFLDAVGGADSARAPYFNSVSGLEIEHAFRDLTFQNSYIENIMVVSKNGNVRFFSKMSTQSGNVNHYYEEGAALKEEWIETAVQAKGKEVFLGYNVLFDDANTTFSMVKELIVPGTGESVGYLVVNIRKTILDKAFAKKGENYATNSYMIVRREDYAEGEDAERNIVYFDGNEEYKDEIVEAYFDSDKASDYLFSSVQNSISGWEIVNVVEKRELSRDSSYIGWIALGLGVLMLLVCALLSMLISRAISSPLDMLEETIREVGNGNYRVDAEFDESEIGKIGSQFKNMVNNNLELHERLMNMELKEKEAELLLLQSQINPHFLYNTLDALYFKALIDRADDVAEMVQALSETFKLSLNKGDKLITVRDEIAKIQAYMKVQNMRHDNRFQFLVELEEEMLPCKMLAFILQPLVENAVYHGLEPKVGNGYVRIEGYMESGDMVFHIIDNGVGIDDMRKLDQGYGVRNVRERIRLFYGEEYILSYDSRISEGTTATVILPILKEEQECTE